MVDGEKTGMGEKAASDQRQNVSDSAVDVSAWRETPVCVDCSGSCVICGTTGEIPRVYKRSSHY